MSHNMCEQFTRRRLKISAYPNQSVSVGGLFCARHGCIIHPLHTILCSKGRTYRMGIDYRIKNVCEKAKYNRSAKNTSRTRAACSNWTFPLWPRY